MLRTVLGAGLLAFSLSMVGCSGAGSSPDSGANVGGQSLLPTSNQNAAAPTISAVNPTSAFPGDVITITGTNFGAEQLGTSRVLFSSDGVNLNVDGGPVALAKDWSTTSILIAVPSTAVSGPVAVVLGQFTATQQQSNSVNLIVKRAFDPNASPKVVFINPSNGEFVGADSPITVVFSRPILLSSLTANVTSVSLAAVHVPDKTLETQMPPKNRCDDPLVCDPRTADLTTCTCIATIAVTSIVDISGELRTTPQTAFRISHTATESVPSPSGDGAFTSVNTIIVLINNSIRADGSLDGNAQPLAVAGPNVPELGERFFYFQE